jgi:hypothetical protein
VAPGIALAILLAARATGAEPIAVRVPEGPAHGFVEVTGEDGKPLAHGEVEQWLRGDTVASRLAFWFADGSIYDEVVRFSQRRVFRLESYRLVQRGPSFADRLDVAFDRTGRYRVRGGKGGDGEEQEIVGRMDLPADLMNGMMSIACKNLMPSGSATVHLATFRPEPLIVELHLAPEGNDEFRVGPLVRSATRFRLQAEVTGLRGALATVAGKQPPPLHMWIASGRAPSLVRFVGPLYNEGPTWRVRPTGPRWERSD